jgi:hypothetical protein
VRSPPAEAQLAAFDNFQVTGRATGNGGQIEIANHYIL